MKPPPQIILDAHLDIAGSYVADGRDFRHSTWITQQREGKFWGHPYDDIGVASVGLPDMLLGRVGLTFASLWVAPHGTPTIPPSLTYQTPREAYQAALRQWDYYQRLADTDPRIMLVRTQGELAAVLESWEEGKDFNEHRLGIVLQMEGADPIIEPRQLEEWVERGVRIVAPAWRATRYSAGTGLAGRLTPLGRELLEVMAGFKLALDVSHLAEEAFYEALDIYAGPAIIATHSNPRRFVPTDRQLSDDMIRRLAERDGVMGVVLYNTFLKEGWYPGRDRKGDVGLKQVLAAIDHICQVTGSARHVGLGTDWDGGFGWESIPLPFDSHVDLWKMGDYLAKHGYAAEDIRNILCGNFLRSLAGVLPA
jgi:membrane dipeptidase